MSKKVHQTNNTHRRVNKITVLLVSLILILGVTVCSTLAFIVAGTETLQNIFNPSTVSCAVHEPGWTDGVSTEKNNVSITNTGDTQAYIRAMVIVTWQNDAGEVHSVMPKENEYYTISWTGIATNGGWEKGADGFYYHKAPVNPKASDTAAIESYSTSELFTACQLASHSVEQRCEWCRYG